MTRIPENLRAMYADAYKLHETLYGMANTPDNWLKACDLISETTIRHGEHPLMVDLSAAVFNQLERDAHGA